MINPSLKKIFILSTFLTYFGITHAQPICTPNMTPEQAFLAIKNANNPRQSSPISSTNAPIQPTPPIQTITQTTTPFPTSTFININTASEAELTQLSGIGSKKAQDIVQYRETTPFRTIDDLANVKGIGIKTVEKNRAMMTVQ